MSEILEFKNAYVSIQTGKTYISHNESEYALYVFINDELISTMYGTEEQISERFRKISDKLSFSE